MKNEWKAENNVTFEIRNQPSHDAPDGCQVSAINYVRGQVLARANAPNYRHALRLYCALIELYAP